MFYKVTETTRGDCLQAIACFISKRLLEVPIQAIAIDSNRLPRCLPITWILDQAIGYWCEANGLLFCEQAIASHSIIWDMVVLDNIFIYFGGLDCCMIAFG